MADQPMRKRWWRGVRISLGSLVIAVAILCAALGWCNHRARVSAMR